MDLARLSSEAGFSWFAKVALVVFLVLFLGVVAWTFTRSKKQMNQQAQIPLEDDVVEARKPRPDIDEEQAP